MLHKKETERYSDDWILFVFFLFHKLQTIPPPFRFHVSFEEDTGRLKLIILT